MAETSGLLNRRRGNSLTEGSNPSVSATALYQGVSEQIRTMKRSEALFPSCFAGLRLSSHRYLARLGVTSRGGQCLSP